MKRVLSLLAIWFTLISSPASADLVKVVERPTWNVGECVWLKYTSGIIQKRCVTNIENDRIKIEAGKHKAVTYYNADFNVTDYPMNSTYYVIGPPVTGYRVVYQGSSCHFDWPLHTGKEWQCARRFFVNGFGYQAWFEVQVGKPEYRTFSWNSGPYEGKQETLEVWPIQQVYRQVWQSWKTTCWYSPALKFHVKCDSEYLPGTYDMVGHNIPPSLPAQVSEIR